MWYFIVKKELTFCSIMQYRTKRVSGEPSYSILLACLSRSQNGVLTQEGGRYIPTEEGD